MTTQATMSKPRKSSTKQDVPLDMLAMLTRRQAAGILNVGIDRVIDWIHRLDPQTGKPLLHSVKIGSFIYIPRKSLDAFIDWLIERGGVDA